MSETIPTTSPQRAQGSPVAWLVMGLSLLLSSCASHKQEKTSDYTDLKLGQRIVKQTKDPFSIRSPFQSEVYNASHTVKTSGFKTTEFQGEKKGFFGRKNKYQAGTFAQAGKESQAASQTFSGVGDKSPFASTTFKTSENQFDGRTSTSAAKTSPFGNQVFKTSSDAGSVKATKNAKRPLIMEDQTTYSEEQVKKLLNKG